MIIAVTTGCCPGSLSAVFVAGKSSHGRAEPIQQVAKGGITLRSL
jgi:hypothetical protein